MTTFSHFRDVVDAHENLNGSRDMTTPLSGTVCHPWTTELALALVNLQIGSI